MLPKSHLEMMHTYVKSSVPLEACGLLAGKGSKVSKVFLIENKSQSQVRFRMDPVEQLLAFAWIEANSMDLLGIFHSHPSGPDTLSETDIAEAAYEVVQIIWSPPSSPGSGRGETWKARGFWIENGELYNVELKITGEE